MTLAEQWLDIQRKLAEAGYAEYSFRLTFDSYPSSIQQSIINNFANFLEGKFQLSTFDDRHFLPVI